jgi:hypothetical protein
MWSGNLRLCRRCRTFGDQYGEVKRQIWMHTRPPRYCPSLRSLRLMAWRKAGFSICVAASRIRWEHCVMTRGSLSLRVECRSVSRAVVCTTLSLSSKIRAKADAISEASTWICAARGYARRLRSGEMDTVCLASTCAIEAMLSRGRRGR